jgi:hypothetical protein
MSLTPAVPVVRIFVMTVKSVAMALTSVIVATVPVVWLAVEANRVPVVIF